MDFMGVKMDFMEVKMDFMEVKMDFMVVKMDFTVNLPHHCLIGRPHLTLIIRHYIMEGVYQCKVRYFKKTVKDKKDKKAPILMVLQCSKILSKIANFILIKVLLSYCDICCCQVVWQIRTLGIKIFLYNISINLFQS